MISVRMTRGRLRATLVVEALLMASSARSSGSASGLLYGWATTTVMFVNLHPVLTIPVLTIPVPHLLAYVALAAIAGAVASALPARRAARASIVAAMAETDTA
jgi:putative ABC transport system permease protein